MNNKKTNNRISIDTKTSMDAKDLKIIQQLDLNPRISESKLAKNVRVSQQVVSYRIGNLLKNKIITQFGTIINLFKLGYKQYHVLLELNNTKEAEKELLMKYLEHHHLVFWVADIGGKWDALILLHVRDYDEFDRFMDNIFHKFPKTIRDYEALFVIRQELYLHKYIHNSGSSSNNLNNSLKNNLNNSSNNDNINSNNNVIKLKNKNYAERHFLDETDLSIIDNFRSNCRSSSLELGEKCNVSYKTVQSRIKKLEEKGIIAGYRIFMQTKIGYNPYLILISFKSYGREEEKRMINYSRQHTLITQLWKLFGSWSLMLHVRAKNNEHLQKFISELRDEFQIIGSYEIIPIFKAVPLYNYRS